MSRIFDGLQKLGAEQTGVEYPDMVSVATEVFETPRDRTFHAPAGSTPKGPADKAGLPESTLPAIEGGAAPEFPSLEVSLPPSSRLVFLAQPDSLAAEKFRFLGVRLRNLQRSRPLKKVLVTSSIPEEGKSLVSANLAGVLAKRKQKVLLLEGDLRRPVLAQQFGLQGLAGLGEWAQSGMQTVSNVYHLAGPGFWFMPAGSLVENPLELLQSGKVSYLMNQLSILFDWIVVDSPPLLPLADTTVWARMTDGTLLVTREGKTEKASLQRGLEILPKTDLLGVVLNGRADMDAKHYYSRYHNPGSRTKQSSGDD
jgi:capsular exopolysaccharide synthesis family protein